MQGASSTYSPEVADVQGTKATGILMAVLETEQL
jgi:hypothetical protein